MRVTPSEADNTYMQEKINKCIFKIIKKLVTKTVTAQSN